MSRYNLSFLTLCLVIIGVTSFAPTRNNQALSSLTNVEKVSSSSLFAGEGGDPSDIIGKRLIVKGDVNGGYVRTCIRNEASRFRRLIGTMSPPEDSDTAEIYIEGKRRNVDGFIRWCTKGTQKVGLSQNLEILKITDEDPTGLYDDFYVKTE